MKFQEFEKGNVNALSRETVVRQSGRLPLSDKTEDVFENQINWFPDYWDLTEKNKLFDFWRFRYTKNFLGFSPNLDQSFGGLGFYDASFESLKYQGKSQTKIFEEVQKEFKNRVKQLEQEFQISQQQDRLRLMLLMEAEKSGFEYYKSKVFFAPIEEGNEDVLKTSLWIIDNKERIFKENLGALISYDRKNHSPVSLPDRKMQIEPLSVNECFLWLHRDGRKNLSEKDKLFFSKNKSLIKEDVDRSQETASFIPVLLLERHKKALDFEKQYHITRDINGEYYSEKEQAVYFSRPKKILKHIERPLSFEEQLSALSKISLKNALDIMSESSFTPMKVGESEEGSNKIKDKPYLVLHEKLFNLFESQDESKRKLLFDELRNFVKKRYGEEETVKEKGSIWRSALFFFLGKKGKVEEKNFISETDKPNLFNLKSSDIIEYSGYMVVNGKELKNESLDDLLPDYIDEFDDSTRFNAKLFEKLGRVLNKEVVLGSIFKTKEKMSGFLNKLGIQNIVQQVSKQTKENPVKIGLETKQERNLLKEKGSLLQNLFNTIKPEKELQRKNVEELQHSSFKM